QQGNRTHLTQVQAEGVVRSVLVVGVDLFGLQLVLFLVEIFQGSALRRRFLVVQPHGGLRPFFRGPASDRSVFGSEVRLAGEALRLLLHNPLHGVSPVIAAVSMPRNGWVRASDSRRGKTRTRAG